MTRLTTEWIKTMAEELPQWGEKLESISHTSLMNLAAVGAGVSRTRISSASRKTRVAVIPVTQGLGIIETFCYQVAEIVKFMGFDAFVTEHTDVWGLFEAEQKGAGIVFLADDMYFLAHNTGKDLMAENSDATARGFVAALEGAANGLRDKSVLVLGGGRVGKAALDFLKCRGALGVIYDTDDKVTAAREAEGYKGVTRDEIKNYNLIVDCTPEGNWITPDMLADDVIFASPGVPLSLTPEAADKVGDNLIHDLLQLGVITMLAMTC